MSQINLNGLINNISEKTTAYTPIVEAIVNSIESIEDSKRKDGVIEITAIRSDQCPLDLDNDARPNIIGFKIKDNGVGFTNQNRDSFDTLYSDQKIKTGGKGFGRFMFLKYYKLAKVESTYEENNTTFKRSFIFTINGHNIQNLIQEEKNDPIEKGNIETTVWLTDLKEEHLNKLDKKLETVARNLVEKLLPFFINDRYQCPKIILKDSDSQETIVLNMYFENYDSINKVAENKFTLDKNGNKENFEVKIFKIYYTKSASSITLTAHNRGVTVEPLHQYVPEFKDEFYEIAEASGGKVNKNYSIKAYVLGPYLNRHVSLERDDFKFGKESDLTHPFSRKEIESNAATVVKEAFKQEVLSRQLKKKERIKQFIDTLAPWHKTYFEDLDLDPIPYDFSDTTIEGELQKLKYDREKTVRNEVNNILAEPNKVEEASQKVEEISKQLTELGKSDLAHYVVLRRVVIELLSNSLKWNEDKKYEKEKTIHNLIFPMNTDSERLPYDKHNLWILDERLSFQEYIASDKPLTNGERPDLLIFDKPIAVRDGDDLSNPITIFEFKRPQRENYANEDPINQICEYVDKIRKGDYKNIEGRPINATENTPAYGFLICDITDDIQKLAGKQYSLALSPDKEGYFGYLSGYNLYIQVISFRKLIKDAELRNRIFFEKLKIK